MCPHERGAGVSVAAAAGEQPTLVSKNVQLPKMLHSKGHAPLAAWSHDVGLWGRGGSAPRPIPPRGRRSASPRLGAGDAPRVNPAVSHGEASCEGAARLNQDARRRGTVSLCARLQLPCLLCSLPSFLPGSHPPSPQLACDCKGKPLTPAQPGQSFCRQQTWAGG